MLPRTPTHATDCLIGLGSNLGDRKHALDSAITAIGQHPGITLIRNSAWYATAPIGGATVQSDFLNGVALVQTGLSPSDLLAFLHDLESRAGRLRTGPQRVGRWAPRTLDLDLLLYGTLIRQQPSEPYVPHPWMAVRPFVLRPAIDVAPEMIHPQLDMTITELWQLADRDVKIITVLRPRVDRQSSKQLKSLLRQCADQSAADLCCLPDSDVGRTLQPRIQFMMDSAKLIAAKITETADRGCFIVHGWWDEVLLDINVDEDLPPEISAASHEVAKTLPVPNVTIALQSHPDLAEQQHASSCQEHEGFEHYLWHRARPSPFFMIPEDPDRILHDVCAIVSGLTDSKLRPAP